MQEVPVRSPGGKDSPEKEMTIYSCILAQEIPWTEEPGGLQSMGLQRVGHALVTEQQCNDCEVYSLFIGCIKQFRSVQLLSLIQLFEISCTAEHQSSLSTQNLQSLLKFMCFKLVMPYTTISSSIIPFFFCPQSLPASGFCQMSQFFSSDGQRIGASASASVLPMNIQDWFPLGGLV